MATGHQHNCRILSIEPIERQLARLCVSIVMLLKVIVNIGPVIHTLHWSVRISQTLLKVLLLALCHRQLASYFLMLLLKLSLARLNNFPLVD